MVLPACMCAPCECNAHRGQERAIVFLGLELTDSCELLGTEPRYSGRVANALNHWTIAPALTLLSFFFLILGFLLIDKDFNYFNLQRTVAYVPEISLTLFFSSLFIIVCLWLCDMCICGSSEDNFKESVTSFHHYMGSKLQSARLS